MGKFSKEELVRYSRQMMLPGFGVQGQEKLKNAKVLVVGAGGLGCPVLQYLNAAGIGTIGIIDFDKVELHNLHRQILYSFADVGRSKIIAAAERLKEQNEHTVFVLLNEMLTEANAEAVISRFDVIVDGSDNFLTRYLVNDTCVKLNKPLVYGSVLKEEGQLAVFNYKGSKNLRDIYPEPPAPESVPNCDENGILGVVPGIIGSWMALKTINVILGTLKDTDQFHLIDLFSGKQMILEF
jgi:molybdopterin/thiamine biosynthesis adenylyltransferase